MTAFPAENISAGASALRPRVRPSISSGVRLAADGWIAAILLKCLSMRGRCRIRRKIKRNDRRSVEICIDGTPRTYRDRKDLAMEAAEYFCTPRWAHIRAAVRDNRRDVFRLLGRLNRGISGHNRPLNRAGDVISFGGRLFSWLGALPHRPLPVWRMFPMMAPPILPNRVDR
jgi:hypothetical protein